MGELLAIIAVPWLMWDKRASTPFYLGLAALICLAIEEALS